MKRSKLSYLITVIIVIFSGCAKDGETGPQGPAGANGLNGNANVTAETFTVSSWSSNSYVWYANLNVASLSQLAQNNGAVQVFYSANNGTTWVALPWTVVGSTNYFMNYLTETDLIQIQWWFNGAGIGSNPNTYFSAISMFKVVVIPPRLVNPKINLNNYEDVKLEYNLQD
ncbi:MAG: hypothetical protein IPN13_06305 [Bacteroidetes bacterium]|nr:hypothetical protein [Bacteroidota bacterium]